MAMINTVRQSHKHIGAEMRFNMKYLSFDFYDDFQCIGGACSNTCCAGWQILIDNVSAAKYHSVSGAFGDKLRSHILTSDKRIEFQHTADGRCSFLTNQNLCEIYQQLGKESLCNTCTIYPRNTEIVGDIALTYQAISCPEAARILFSRTDPLQVNFGEDTVPASQTDINWDFFNLLVSGFTTSMDILQNRSFCLSTRLRLLLLFTQSLQNAIDNHADTASIFGTFSSPESLAVLVSQLNAIPHHFDIKYVAFVHFFYNYEHFMNACHFLQIPNQSLLPIQPENYIPKFAHFLTPAYDIKFENYCVYYLFTTYFRACDSRKPIRQIAQLIYLLNLLQCYTIPFISQEDGELPLDKLCLTTSYFARILEHSTKNRKADVLYQLYHECSADEEAFLMSLT
jgi:lysine-N-methylase